MDEDDIDDPELGMDIFDLDPEASEIDWENRDIFSAVYGSNDFL
jgi:hypothetical protein